MQEHERLILVKIQNGDEEAFQYIFRKYFQSLLIFSKKFVDEKNAEDFIQDCFLDLWDNRKKIQIKTSLSAYLFTVIKNKCYNYLKQQKKKHGKSSEIGLKLKLEELNYFINSEKSLLEFDIQDRIQSTYEVLPDKCRQVFWESRANNLTNKEIADKLGISIKAVEKHITKALKIFKAEFKDFISVILALFIPFL